MAGWGFCPASHAARHVEGLLRNALGEASRGKTRAHGLPATFRLGQDAGMTIRHLAMIVPPRPIAKVDARLPRALFMPRDPA